MLGDKSRAVFAIGHEVHMRGGWCMLNPGAVCICVHPIRLRFYHGVSSGILKVYIDGEVPEPVGEGDDVTDQWICFKKNLGS